MAIDKWSISHRYQKLVKAGLASPITGADGVPCILRVDEAMEPVWWSPSRDAYLTPGLRFWQDMRDAVDSVDLDNLNAAITL